MKMKGHNHSIPHERRYNAWPGIGFLAGMCIVALGFMGLGPGGDARRALAWLAELERGRPICGEGAF